jgi:hypothetical protein
MNKDNAALPKLRTVIRNFSRLFQKKGLTRILGVVLTLLIVGYLVYRLTEIGWEQVLRSLPVTSWFYVLLVLKFFTLPFFQVLIFRRVWKNSFINLFPAMVNKMVLDKNVLDISGDVFLYLWAAKNVSSSKKAIFHTLKDNLIMSSAASTFQAVALLLIFFSSGLIIIPKDWLSSRWGLVILVLLAGLVLLGLAFRLRKTLFYLERKELMSVFGLHLLRLLTVQCLQIAQWALVLPQVRLSNLISLLAAQIIISRIPFLPSRHLIFFGAGLEIAESLSIPSAALAGILLAENVINQILTLSLFLISSLTLNRRELRRISNLEDLAD